MMVTPFTVIPYIISFSFTPREKTTLCGGFFTLIGLSQRESNIVRDVTDKRMFHVKHRKLKKIS